MTRDVTFYIAHILLQPTLPTMQHSPRAIKRLDTTPFFLHSQ